MISFMVGLTALILFGNAIVKNKEDMAVAVLPFETTGIDKRLETIVTNTIRGVISA